MSLRRFLSPAKSHVWNFTKLKKTILQQIKKKTIKRCRPVVGDEFDVELVGGLEEEGLMGRHLMEDHSLDGRLARSARTHEHNAGNIYRERKDTK